MSEEEKVIPYERFATKVSENKALKENLQALQGEVDNFKQAQEGAVDWQNKYQQAVLEAGTAAQHHSNKVSMLKAGVSDDETAELVMWRFTKSGLDDTQFDSWLSEQAPQDRLLAHHFAPPPSPGGPAPAPASTPEPAPAPAPAAFPDVNLGTRTAPPPRAEFSRESVAAMSIEDLKKNKNNILSAWGYGGKK